MRYLTLIAAILISFQSFSQEGIKFFEGSWNELLAFAKKENKPIFVDAYTTWCGPCKQMSKYVFTDSAVGIYYNQTFVCAKFDMEKGEGKDIAKKYGVRAYPTLLYIDNEGVIMHKVAGSMKPEDFIQLGMDATDENKSLAGLKKKYETGVKTDTLLLKYAKVLRRAYDDYDKVVAEFFALVPNEKLTEEINWQAIQQFIFDMNSPQFTYMLDHYDEFTKIHGVEDVNKKISDVIQNAVYQIARKKDKEKYEELKKTIATLNLPEKEKSLADCDLLFYKTSGDWEGYCSAAAIYINTIEMTNPDQINELAWTLYRKCEDLSVLAEVEKLLVKGIAIKDSYAIHDTWAAILGKLGKKEEAIAAANEAIELAKKEEVDYAGTEVLINQLQGNGN